MVYRQFEECPTFGSGYAGLGDGMQIAAKLHSELLRDKYLERLEQERDDAKSKEATRGF